MRRGRWWEWLPSVAQLLPREVDEDGLERRLVDRQVVQLGAALLDGLQHDRQRGRRALDVHAQLPIELHDVGDDAPAIQRARQLREVATGSQRDDRVGVDARLETLRSVEGED